MQNSIENMLNLMNWIKRKAFDMAGIPEKKCKNCKNSKIVIHKDDGTYEYSYDEKGNETINKINK